MFDGFLDLRLGFDERNLARRLPLDDAEDVAAALVLDDLAELADFQRKDGLVDRLGGEAALAVQS